jgi:hypothetical protein
MAVVEPLLPLVDAESIRDEIELARSAADPDPALEPVDGDAEEWAHERVEPGPVPTAGEVRAAFGRIAARLPGATASG